MADLLEQASAWLGDMQHKHASRAVTYERGALQVEVDATIGRTVFEVDDGFGVLEKFEARDYLVRSADLVLGGSVVLPERGDRIRETAGSATHIYEVMAPGKEPPWRYSDPYRKTLRIHSKQIDSLTA